MPTKECTSLIKLRRRERKLGAKARLERNKVVNLGYDEEAALAEANRCLGKNTCESCNLCELICPDMCITRNDSRHKIEINYDLCSGCGICAFMCPKGAIKMVPELSAITS